MLIHKRVATYIYDVISFHCIVSTHDLQLHKKIIVNFDVSVCPDLVILTNRNRNSEFSGMNYLKIF